MKKEILIGAIAFVVVLSIFFIVDPLTKGINGNVVKEIEFETKYSESTVIVDLKPKRIENDLFYVEIGVNTHTIELNKYDLKELITLEYDGKVIKPESVPVLSGHHNYGDLIFKVDGNMESFIIKVKGLAEIEERVFEW